MAEQTTTDFERLLNALDSKDEQTRTEAIRQVRVLPPDALLTLSQMEVQHFRLYRRRQWRQAALIVFGVYSPIWGFMWYAHAKFGQFIIFGIYMPLMMYGILPTIRMRSDGYQPSRARRSLTAVLEEVQDVSFVPVALTLLQDKTKEITPIITDLLKRLLPQLHAGDAQAWTPRQYQALLQLLLTPLKDIDLALCVLKALEQIGDARAILSVTALMNAPTGVGTIRLRTAAQECLPYLQQRAEVQTQLQTLLRPMKPHDSSETLLRSATPTTLDAPNEQLLRPR